MYMFPISNIGAGPMELDPSFYWNA